MKKTNLMKAASILLISTMVILFNASVFAADNTGFNDLTSTLSNSSNNSSNSANANVAANNTNSSLNTNVNNNSSNTNRTNSTLNTNVNNSSIYNNTDLPKTGVESSIPVAMLVVILGISAVYAYRKINEYRNI